MRTFNRTPKELPIASDDSRMQDFTIVEFKGIQDTENDVRVSPLTFSDSKNVYMNNEDILSSRPSLKMTDYTDLGLVSGENIKNVWVVDDIMILHIGTSLKFIKNKVLSVVSVSVGKIISALESIENYIFVYPANIYVNMSSKNESNVNTFATGSIYDLAYIPTIKLRSGSEVTYPEKSNMISNKHKESIIYDSVVGRATEEFVGKEVTISVDSKDYEIENYRFIDNDVIQKQSAIIENYMYIKYSSIGSAIAYKPHTYYYAPDGKTFSSLKLPSFGNALQNGYITEVGDAIFVPCNSGVYALSLIETEWDSVRNIAVKRWEDWTLIEFGAASRASSVGASSGSVNKISNYTKTQFNAGAIFTDSYIDYSQRDLNQGVRNRFINENTFVYCAYRQNEVDGSRRPIYCIYNNSYDEEIISIEVNIPDTRDSGYPLGPHQYSADIDPYSMRLSLSVGFYTSYTTRYISDYTLKIVYLDLTYESGNYTYTGKYGTVFTASNLSFTSEMSQRPIQLIYDSSHFSLLTTASIERTGNPSNYYAMKLTRYEYSLTQGGYFFEDDHYVMEQAGVHEQSFAMMMSRSSSKILTSDGLFIYNSTSDEYDHVPYLESTINRVLYVDDSIIVTGYQNESYNIYTSRNVIATLSTLVVDNTFVAPTITLTAKSDYIYFASGKMLYIGQVIYDKDENMTLYFSSGLWEEFDEEIFQLQIISEQSLGVYCRNSIWIISKSEEGIFYKTKSKITSSCRDGDSVSLSINGKGSMFACHRGIGYIEHQNLLSIEEQQLSFISDNVQTFIVDWIKNKSIKLFTYEFWLYAYSPQSTTMWIMDLRDNSWWKWEVPKPVDKMILYLNEIYVLTNNNLCSFIYDEDYKDVVSKTGTLYNESVIEWFIESQRMYFKQLNRYKHIYSITINNRTDDDIIDDKFIRLQCMIYRDTISRTPEEILNYKVAGRKAFTKRLRIFKCNFFKYRLSSDTKSETEKSNYHQEVMKIDGINIKYGIRERIR